MYLYYKTALILITLNVFSLFCFTQNTIWLENFNDISDLTTSDNGITKWNTYVDNCTIETGDKFYVENKKFTANDTDCEAVWISDTIDISQYNSIYISCFFSKQGEMESTDYISLSYKTENNIENNITILNNNFNDTTIVSDIIKGDFVVFYVKVKNNSKLEFHYFDDFTIIAPIWHETFTLDNGLTYDNGLTKWNINYENCGIDSTDIIGVFNNKVVINDIDDTAIWSSDFIDISECDFVNISLDISERGDLENGNFIKICLKVDNSDEIFFYEFYDDFDSEKISINNIHGDSLKIIVYFKNNANNEFYEIDNILVDKYNFKTFYSINNGNWNDPNIWNVDSSGNVFNEIPDSNSHAILNHSIYCNSHVDIMNLTLKENSTINFSNNQNKLSLKNNGNLFIESPQNLNLSLNLSPTSYHTINTKNSNTSILNKIVFANNSNITLKGNGILNIDTIIFSDKNSLVNNITNGLNIIEKNINNGFCKILNYNTINYIGEKFSNLKVLNNKSIFNYCSDKNQQISTYFDYYNLTASNNGIKSFIGSLNVTNNLNIKDSAVLKSDTNIIKIGGNWVNEGDLENSFLEDSGSLEFNGIGNNQLIKNNNNETFNNLTINKLNGGDLNFIDSTCVIVTGNLNLNEGCINTRFNNKCIYLTKEASSNQGNSKSFVKGTFIKECDSSFIFPLGDKDVWARIGVSELDTCLTFKVDYNSNCFYNTTDLINFNTISTTEYWSLDKLENYGNAKVTLYWENGESYNGITDINNLIVASWNGSSWEDKSKFGKKEGSSDFGNITSGLLSDFSFFTFGSYESNPLPIDLLSFYAINNKSYIKLLWQSFNYINKYYYLVEKSVDGLNFKPIDSVFIDNFSSNHEFSSVDYNPINGTSYYRLKQYYTDNNFEYSKIISVNYKSEKEKIKSYTYNNIMYVEFEELENNSEINIKLFNTNSDLVYENTILELKNNKLSFPINNLPKGIYFLQIKESGYIYNSKVIK